MAGGPAEHQLAQPGVTVGAHDQQIRAVRCSLGKEDFAGVAVRLVDWLRLHGNAMSPQHRRRRVEIPRRFLADRAEDHPLRTAQERQRFMQGACRLARAVPACDDARSHRLGGLRRQHQDRHARGHGELLDHMRPLIGLRSEHQVHGARRLGQKPLRFALGFLPYHAGSRAADALEGGLDPLLDLLVDLPLRLDQFGQHIGQRLAVGDRYKWRRHHMHADQYRVEPPSKGLGSLQAGVKPAVAGERDENCPVGHENGPF